MKNWEQSQFSNCAEATANRVSSATLNPQRHCVRALTFLALNNGETHSGTCQMVHSSGTRLGHIAFGDVPSLQSWASGGCCDEKQVLHKNHVEQAMRVPCLIRIPSEKLFSGQEIPAPCS